jgi:hypothetical protein
MADLSIFSLIGERYLDTQHSREYIEKLEHQLKSRGVVGLRRWLYEYAAASSLWWNVLWWEWANLDQTDVAIGWKQNAALFSVVAIFSTVVFGPYAGLLSVMAVHLLTTGLGFLLRQGTIKRE